MNDVAASLDVYVKFIAIELTIADELQELQLYSRNKSIESLNAVVEPLLHA